MNDALFPKFIEMYQAFQKTTEYTDRVQQFRIVEVNREIITETLLNEPLLNEHLTGLIQMFKHGCLDETFNRYLEICVTNEARRKEISDKAIDVDEWGYTGAGLNAVTKLNPENLSSIKTFLQNAFNISTSIEAMKLCREFDSLKIPYVKSGIYSPWLYYINPELFPILNDSHIAFRTWIEMPADYPSCIQDYNKLKELVKEDELGVLDKFAYSFEETTGKGEFDIDIFIKSLHNHFPNIWRCATSGNWNEFLDKNVLSINWLNSNTDYTSLSKIGQGKMSIERWVNQLKIGDLIVVLDRYKYYGIAVAQTEYNYHGNDLEIKDKDWPVINVKYLHEVKNPVDHNLGITHTNPATFYNLQGLSFNEKDTFSFIEETFPEAIRSILNYMTNLTPVTDPNTFPLNNNNAPMNTILYGPPGTGKTYHSITHSVAIVENTTFDLVEAEERKTVKTRFDDYVKDGRIVFATFHQSLGYEDFIEGIKPIEPDSEEEQLTYAVEDGIFKKLCTEAAFSFIRQNTTPDTEQVLDFSSEYDRFINSVNERFAKGEKVELVANNAGTIFINSISQKNNILASHYDGGRNYTVSKKRLGDISKAFPDLTTISNINDQFRSEIGGSNTTIYWAVLNAIRNQETENQMETDMPLPEKKYSYDDKKDIIESLKNDDYKAKDAKQFVLIIDEINRGNVSQIFGELISLIEEDKRLGKEEALKAVLPYSKDKFGVPCNVHIIGTMNTADRSVEALDTALRRRFSFVHMVPQEDKLTDVIEGINMKVLLETINNRLRIFKDNDHTIGHSWFWDVKNVEQLKTAFANKILPLLQEYFYNDYEKLGLVLGDSFFELPHKRVAGNEFAQFSGSNGLSGQYRNKYLYKLKNACKLEAADFLSLTQAIPESEN